MIFKSGSFDSPSISASLASLQQIKAYTFLSSHDEATENHKKLVRWKIENLINN